MIMEELDKILEDKIFKRVQREQKRILKQAKKQKLLAYKAIHLEQISNA